MWHLTQEDIDEILQNHDRRLLAALSYVNSHLPSQPDYQLMVSGKVTEDDVRALAQYLGFLKILWVRFGGIYHVLGDGKKIVITLGSEPEKRSGPGRRTLITYAIFLSRDHLSFGYLRQGEAHQLLNFKISTEADLNRQLEAMFVNIKSEAVYKFFVYASDFFSQHSFSDIIKTVEKQIISPRLPQEYLAQIHTA